MENPRIVRIEWAQLVGERPRQAGCNSRLGVHGLHVRPPIARITTEDGTSGFGRCYFTKEQATEIIGLHLHDLFQAGQGVPQPYRTLEYPLWDLVGKQAEKPVYALLGGKPDADGVFRARCYDTSLYIDDLHIGDHDEAAAFIAAEALEGKAKGHKAYKIKVGRGAMHMPLEVGTHRDISVIRAVREAVGPDATIMLDANNGYNLNLTKRVLGETADAKVYWMEEAFHEDGSFYTNLKRWLEAEKLETRIADGEGGASPRLLDWARDGLIDIVQYDIFGYGFTAWLELGARLDGWKVGSAPHHYGGHYGNFASAHLAAGIQGFEFVEWDEAHTPGLDTSAYSIENGLVNVPNLPGFGIRLEEDVFLKAVKESGFVVQK